MPSAPRHRGRCPGHPALYQAAQEARQRTEEAGRSKDLFLAMLSHELRTPLTPILTAVSARLEQGVGPELRPELEMIRRNVALEARLIDDLLDLSRIERGRLRLDRESVDVHRVIVQAVEICRDETFVAGLEVLLRLAAAVHHVEGDHARILQIIWNLIGNAAKFTSTGGTLTIRTRNEVAGGPDAGAGRWSSNSRTPGGGSSRGCSRGSSTRSGRGRRTCTRDSAGWVWGWPSAGRWPRRMAGA